MIKFRTECTNGERDISVIGFGLSAINIELMMSGRPIFFDGQKMGIDGYILILYGRTEQEIRETLDSDYITSTVSDGMAMLDESVEK